MDSASEDEDADEASADVQETLGEALGERESGWVLMGDAIPSDWTGFVRRGAYRMSARSAQPIIISQLHEQMEELGDAVDNGRRQVLVPRGGGG